MLIMEANSSPFARSTGVGCAKNRFEKGEMERTEAVPKGNCAGEPRRAVLTFAHFHKAQVEDYGRRGNVTERDGGKCVALPDAAGEKALVAGWNRFVWQRAN